MEKVLTFQYPFECIEDVEKLKRIFLENNIEFICYKSDGYYSHEFVVRKSNKKWDELYKIINSVHTTKFNFKKTSIKLIDGELKEVEYIYIQ